MSSHMSSNVEKTFVYVTQLMFEDFTSVLFPSLTSVSSVRLIRSIEDPSKSQQERSKYVKH